MQPFQILEVANTHGGEIQYVFDLIYEFEEYRGYGMKFQPLHPDKIATSDFEWYPVYKELFFSNKEWTEIINAACLTKEVWLDLFDDYGVQVFKENAEKVKGVKLQSSILFNESIIQRLAENPQLQDHSLIINVSGLEIHEIRERFDYFQNTLRPNEVLIEVGFQAYPTELRDSGYVKIQEIKVAFGCRVIFADHSDGRSDDAIWLPILAAMNGADGLEKHVMHSSRETKYDHFSSLTKNRYQLYVEKLEGYLALKHQPFINERERDYLGKTIQIPLALDRLNRGTLIDFRKDLEFKRSGRSGLSVPSLRRIQESLHILSVNVERGSTLKQSDFKKANIATIIACRLKSSRLPKKALLKIGELASVERCIESCKKFSNINYTILATSDLDEDADLGDYLFDDSVIFHRGDPEDVIARYLTIADKLMVDVIVRVTADCPYVSNDIVQILLASHFENGADYTAASNAAVGTTAEIINVSAMHKVKTYFPNADYSEYMTWYFQNNPDHFKLNIVVLPDHLSRTYRLTLDYEEDLILFNRIQDHLTSMKIESSIQNIFNYLDANPDVASINSHLTLKYKTDAKLIQTLNSVTKIVISSL